MPFADEDDEEMDPEERELQQAILRNFFEAHRHEDIMEKPEVLVTDECDTDEIDMTKRKNISLLFSSGND